MARVCFRSLFLLFYSFLLAMSELGPSWMGQLLHDSNLRLTELVIPGTHHSGSYSIRSMIPFGRNIGCTQSTSVYEQLCHGARYLDLRVGPVEDDTFAIWHSFLRGAKIEDILNEVKDFCREHTDEIVIVELVPEFGRPFTDEQKQACLELCLSVLGQKLLRCYPDESSTERTYPKILQTSYRQILNSGSERVLLLLHHRFNNVLSSDSIRAYQCRFLRGSRFLVNPWHNTNRRDQLQQRNLRCLFEECDRNPARQRLVCSQLVATPQAGGTRQILTLVSTGTRSLWPRTLARKLYSNDSDDGTLLEWFRQTLKQSPAQTGAERSKYDQDTAGWNICSVDFIELCPELIETMILTNQR